MRSGKPLSGSIRPNACCISICDMTISARSLKPDISRFETVRGSVPSTQGEPRPNPSRVTSGTPA